MTVVGVDDTDSRAGMCTTYLAARLARQLRERAAVQRLLLVRLNPAVEFKTRGNGALAVHTDAGPQVAFDAACEVVAGAAEPADDTAPGVVVAPEAPGDVPAAVAEFAREAVRDHLTVAAAEGVAGEAGYRVRGWGVGRGRIGALAAVGAWRALEEWTYERIAYRERARWGTPRAVDQESVFRVADRHYPEVWDTVDRGEGEAVCVPHTPGPVLYGVRGDSPAAVEAAGAAIDSEPVAHAETFTTNQGTDTHLRTAEELRDGRAYRVTATVASSPETRRGGHVFLTLEDAPDCVAFEPTKRFRDVVRALRPGDRMTACGELDDGTIKLEKLAVRELVRTERTTPDCPDCGRGMESAGADQGWRCRDCGTTTTEMAERRLERDIEVGWYEVPPTARRHIAKPLVRGGFDGAVHPER